VSKVESYPEIDVEFPGLYTFFIFCQHKEAKRLKMQC